ncbi:FAD/NAD(P)-binding domain-containing protein [Phanerochaete sordida]|uniref:FAD/NAD(P)-binding domain-containing protein n=1 Tax=Phanerochaete sordida TaxID=48140 RepID=A0A9P3GF80_9APHY|nr:FAD/NAD(P)-binding domain-containing protein [Phanerochaete sordida]
MSKILKKWAGGDELAKTAVLNIATPWYDLHTGEKMGAAQWRPAVMKETGGDFLLMKHEDVHRLVYRLAVEAGAIVDFGVSVAEVAPGNPRPRVTLSTGEVLEADLVIGADGPRSIVRPVVLGRPDDAVPSGFTIFGTTIPAEEMQKDPELAKLVQANEWPIMMGTHRSLCAHPVKGKTEFAVQMYWPDADAHTPADAGESWYDAVPASSIDYSNLGPMVQRMMQLPPYLYRTRWMVREEEIDEWIDDSGRIVLIGEAAHPWFPGGTYGPAMVLEDAVVFGTLFAHLSAWREVPRFLNAYQEIRYARTKSVNEMDVGNAAFVRLPPGPEAEARNVQIRQARDEWDDGSLKREFEGLAGLFCYEAEDAAQEWWVTWGRYHRAQDEEKALNDTEDSFNKLSL